VSRINVFIHITLDGFYAGPNGEIDWFKSMQKSDDFEKYTHGESKDGITLLFGRTTYEMMKSFWPTPDAENATARTRRRAAHPRQRQAALQGHEADGVEARRRARSRMGSSSFPSSRA
jgi:dihydrofolate reductase